MNKKHHLIISVFALLAMVGLLTACGGGGSSGGGAPTPIGVNIDFGAQAGTPAAIYPAAASQPGEWNNIVDVAGIEQPLNDLSGAVSSLKISVTSDFADGVGGSSTTDDDKLLNDNFYSSSGATWTVLMTGIPSGDYSLYIYGPSHTSVPTGDMTINGTAVASIAGGGTLVLGTSYTIELVTISNGTLTMSGVNAGSYAGLAGLQLVTHKTYALTGTPTPTTVFDTIDQTYMFSNNLSNSIWQRQTDIIVTGYYNTPGYWAFASMTAVYPAVPNNGVDIHDRMVQIPATNTVVYSNANGSSSGGPANSFMVATISTTTGLLSADQTAVFSDGFTGNCELTSSSSTEFLCYDGTVIRRYLTTAGSQTLTANGTLTLSTTLPAAAHHPSYCWGGCTFAFDGAYYYFAATTSGFTGLDYIVYDTSGTLVNTYTATGIGYIHGVYFDWSVGRYSTHDGYGTRVGGTVYGTDTSDSHSFGAISTAHTLQ